VISNKKTKNLDPVTLEFVEKHYKDCSITTLAPWQIVFYLLSALVLSLLLFYRWDIFLLALTLILSCWYFAAALFRGVAVWSSLWGHGEHKFSKEELSELKHEDLPVYTILLPLYKEANVANKIIRSMKQLDYPSHKLDIKLLLEADDHETLNAVNNCVLPDNYDVIVVPDNKPKTKPRACNFGLKRAKGEFCVIFDAEDRPDPDQLKKAVAVFRKSSEKLACVQAKLNYYNAKQNLLTRLFTIEYSTTFDLLLPGLVTFKVPVPLGGTSNHFRTSVLREIGGWDPFNVTEDCDLGIRIYKRGYKTGLMDSTTWEEANSQVWNWLRQRSRWVKGFVQTHFTHMRHPFRTFRQLGAGGMFGFYLCVGASSFMMLANVFYWIVGLVYGGLLWHGYSHGLTLSQMIMGPHDFPVYKGITVGWFQLEAWPLIYCGPEEGIMWSAVSIFFFSISVILLLANFMFVGCHLLACLKRRWYSLLPAALLMPFYWMLISIGAWKGFLQFFTNPFYWEKTLHGLDEAVDTGKVSIAKPNATPEVE
jgi:cellulose synthase/poly-beta-1,6-N-acetylglucosamine synthase-like glycosyltransferase